MATVIKHRRDTAANWTSAASVLAEGEIGYETDTGKFKIGDGTTAWASLSYFTAGSSMDADAILAALLTVDGAGSGLDADLLDGVSSSGYTTTAQLSAHEADTTSVHGISDTSILLTTTAHDSRDHSAALSTAVIDDLSDVVITAAASGDILRHNGTAWVDAVGTTHFEVAGAVATHEADTTSVHGIADTSTLYRSGGTDVAVADGGTGASDASTARTNLGVDYTTLDERTRDVMGTALVAGSNITITPNDGADTITIASTAAGSTARVVLLPIGGGTAPDASGSGNNPATPSRVVSGGTQTTNTPKASYATLLFDQSTDEHWLWQFKLPSDYVSGGTIRLGFGAVPTSGNVIWKAGICEFSTAAPVFLAADVSSATAVPADTDDVTEATITLTMTSLAANDEVVLFIGRDADNGSDTAAGDAILITASFEYVAS